MKTLKNILVSFAEGDIENATDKNILSAYNNHFNTSVKTLTEVEYKNLAFQVNSILRDNIKGKKDSISTFVFKEQYFIFFRELIKHKGFFFAMFICLMGKLVDVKIVKI